MSMKTETVTTQEGIIAVLRQLLRDENVYAAIGHAATMAAQLTIDRPDLMITIRDGMIGVGYIDQPYLLAFGTSQVQPASWVWEQALLKGAALERRAVESPHA